jgi:hypothetical protein
MGKCARCGRADQLHVHHRRLRSHGGDSSFANLVTLCTGCHQWVHAHPSSARGAGWLTGHGGVPAEIPVDHFSWPGQPVLLNEDGTISFWFPQEIS